MKERFMGKCLRRKNTDGKCEGAEVETRGKWDERERARVRREEV
jgi:hypothetical protein